MCKRIVNIIKVSIERNNMQVALFRFRKKYIDFIDVGNFEGEYTFATDLFTKLGSSLSLMCRHCSVQAVRTESRSNCQFGSKSNSLFFTPFLTV